MFARRYDSERGTRWLLVGLMLLGFGLRVVALGDKSVWWDEGLAAWAARQSLAAIASWTAHDVHPPLYFWLLHFWRLLSGESEFGLRLLSAIFGLLTIPATYLLGKRINGRFTGLLAALFITISRFDIGWAQEMRMYALAALLGAWALWAAVGVWQVGRRRDWLLYILFMVLGLYNLYLAVMVLVTANLVWLFFVWPRAADRWRNFWQWSLAQTAVLLLYAPWLFYALSRIPTWSQANPVEPWSFLKIYWTVLTVGIPLDVDQYATLTVPVLLVFLLGVGLIGWRARKRPLEQQKLALLLLGLLLPALVVYLVSLPKASFFYSPPLAPRYLIIFLAAFAVLLGWGIDGLSNGRFDIAQRRRSRPLGFLAAGLAVYAALFGLNSYHNNRVLFDDFPSLTATIAAYRQPDDAVVLYNDTDWPIFAYHYADFWHGIPGAWQMTPQQAHDFLDPIWQQHEGLWLVRTQYAAIGDPEQHVVNWLTERAAGELSYPYGDKQLLFFARTPDRAAKMETLIETEAPFVLDTAVPHLTGYDLQTHDFHSGETMHLFLYWAGGSTAEPVDIGVRPASGGVPFLLATVAAPTSAEPVRQQVDLLVSADLTSGPYQFYAETAEGTAVFGHLTIRQKEANFLTPADVTIQNRVDASFEQGIRLLGYDLGETTFSPGEAIPLTLYWQGAGQIGQRFKVFTHVLGEVYNINSNNFLWGQQDNEPENGRRPTTTWRTDEIIRDAYAIPLDPLAPPGVYQIEIGLYDPITGVRLLLDDGSDHRILTTIRVE
ncbi:MAG: glycosyltransferase family 39 protein [Anaerolineae bacterium]|nr:glycosyltransferase family 39 protein [Anaerolineae bacterium]